MGLVRGERSQEEYRWISCWIIIDRGEEEGHHNNDNNAWPVPRTTLSVLSYQFLCGCARDRRRETQTQDERIKQANQPSPWQQHKPICLPAPLRTTTFTFMNICTKESITHSLSQGPPVCLRVCFCVQPIHHRHLRCCYVCMSATFVCVCVYHLHTHKYKTSHKGWVIIITVT